MGMLARKNGMMRWVMGLALAYALLFQSFAGAMAGTLHAFRAAQASEWCMPSGAAAPGGEVPAHLDICCVLGCAAAQPVPGTGPQGGIGLPLPARDTSPLAFPIGEAPTLPAAAPCGFEARGPPGSA